MKTAIFYDGEYRCNFKTVQKNSISNSYDEACKYMEKIKNISDAEVVKLENEERYGVAL